MSARILVVEDDALLRDALILTLNRAGLDCEGAGDGEEGLARLQGGEFALVITDMRMPRMSGLEMINGAREHLPAPPEYILLSGFHDYSEAELFAAGVSVVLSKPISIGVLREKVFAALERRGA